MKQKSSHRKPGDFAVNNSYTGIVLHVDLSKNAKATTGGSWKEGTEKVSLQDGEVLACCGRSAKHKF